MSTMRRVRLAIERCWFVAVAVSAVSIGMRSVPANDLSPALLEQACVDGRARAVTMSLGDFDEDGTPDLVSGVRMRSNGFLAFRRGTLVKGDSSLREARWIPTSGEVDWISDVAVQLHSLPESMDFIRAGDFDADGHLDVVTAMAGSKTIYFLFGDGHGAFGRPRGIELAGKVTAVTSGEIGRADGVDDLVVGIDAAMGPRVIVFEASDGAFNAQPESFDLPSKATALMLGRFAADFMVDLVVASGRDLVLIRGRDISSWGSTPATRESWRVSTRSFPSEISSLAQGHFLGNHRTSLAMLFADGDVATLDPVNGRTTGESNLGFSPIGAWRLSTVSKSPPSGRSWLVSASASSHMGDELLVVNARDEEIRFVRHENNQEGSVHVDGDTVAVLPVDEERLLILRAGHAAPEVISALPNETTGLDGNDENLRLGAELRTLSQPTGGGRGSGRANNLVDAYAIRMRHAGTTVEVLASKIGAVATEYDDNSATPLTPVRGGIVSYIDQQVFGLDYSSQTYVPATLEGELERGRSERQLIRSSTPAEIGPLPALRAATLRRLPMTRTIQGIQSQAYLLTDALGKRWRLFFGNGLPRPSGAIRKKLAGMFPGAVERGDPDCEEGEDGRHHDSCESDRVASPAQQVAGRVLLRAEIQVGSTWNPVFIAESVRRTRVATTSFAVPEGWHEQIGTDSRDTSAARSPTSTDCTPQAVPTNAYIRRGVGPVSNHPEVFPFFWGSTFANPAHRNAVNQMYSSLANSFDASYLKFLAQYDVVGAGGLGDLRIFDGNPPAAAGSGGTGAVIGNFILDRMGDGSGPLFWATCCSGPHDPIYAVFIPDTPVIDSAGWDGYHLIVPSGEEFIPWPFSLFQHEGIPFMVSRVKEAAMLLQCDPRLRFAGVCASDPGLAEFDHATESASHEFVEASTDPIPIFSNIDPFKIPAWFNGENADICQINPSPWRSHSVVNGFAVSTYWSNEDLACVPESRPRVDIIQPHDGDTILWQPGGPTVQLLAAASDPIQGDISSTIQWLVDGSLQSHRGAVITSPPLSLGGHTFTATVTTVSDGLISDGVEGTISKTRSSCVSVRVAADPPNVTILSPSDGGTYGDDQTILFRGDAQDPQDGTLHGSSLSWFANSQLIGTGETVSHKLTTIGDVAVTLVAVNSAGLGADATVIVHIGPGMGIPFVNITAPQSHTLVAPGDVITFTAVATDVTGAQIPDASISWYAVVDPACDPTTGCIASVLLGHGGTLNSALPAVYGSINVEVIATDPVRGTMAIDAIVLEQLIP